MVRLKSIAAKSQTEKCRHPEGGLESNAVMSHGSTELRSPRVDLVLACNQAPCIHNPRCILSTENYINSEPGAKHRQLLQINQDMCIVYESRRITGVRSSPPQEIGAQKPGRGGAIRM